MYKRGRNEEDNNNIIIRKWQFKSHVLDQQSVPRWSSRGEAIQLGNGFWPVKKFAGILLYNRSGRFREPNE